MRGALGNQRVYRDLNAADGDGSFSSVKRCRAFRHRASNVGGSYWGLKALRRYEGRKGVKCYRKYYGLLIKKKDEEIIYRSFSRYCKLIIRKVSSMNMILDHL